MSIDKEFLIKNSEKMEITLNDVQCNMFSDYADYLIEVNKVMNLTTITEYDEICLLHFIDSILLLKYVDIPDNAKLIDVGTGAGFPGVPCKIMRHDIDLTLMDSLNKRVKFLNNLCEKLKLKANFVHARAEELANNKEHREKYDIATARAVAKLNELAEYCLPFVKIGGCFIALKSVNIKEEIENSKKAIEELGGELRDVVYYTLPNGDPRAMVIIKKISQTMTKYPRQSNKIKKSPL